MKLGSLFDGSGGFPLAGTLCGIEPVWAAEVEPYPIAVTSSRFPNVKHLGSVTDIHGGKVEPVDIITFGSPCQDLSVAGKRAGLKHEANGDEETTRSGLFMEAVRIIKEMRRATNGLYPTFAVWENVPGAFSSNRGEDFRIVLEELIKIAEPTAVMPAVPKGGWAYADYYRGDGWSIGYRVLDAQYWGVPQRRRRIYLVADFRGQRARKILFEREGLRGHLAESGETRQAVAAYAEGSVGADDCAGAIRDVIPINTMIATRHKQLGRGTGFGVGEVGDSKFTISAGHEHAVAYVCERVDDRKRNGVINLNKDDVQSKAVLDPAGIAPALYAGECRGGGGECYVLDKAVAYSFDSLASNSMKSANPHSGCRQVEVSKTLDTTHPDPSKNQGGIAVVETVYCLQGNGIDRSDTAGCNGKGCIEDVSYTLNTLDRHAVAYLASGKNAVGTLMANCGTKLWQGNQEAFSGDYHIIEEHDAPKIRYIVRRLTPTECARLQGFADCWGDIEEKTDFTDEEYAFWLDVRNTHAAINGKATKSYTREQMVKWYNGLHTDSAEYKMWGNGIALPCARYVLEGIAEVARGELMA